MIYIFHILICFCMVVFQTTIAPYSDLLSSFYDLLVVFVIYLAYFRSPRESIPMVLFFGMVMDVFSGGIFGMYATVYFWLYLCVTGMTLFIRKNNLLLLPVVALFGVVFENLVMFGITALLDTGATIPESAFTTVAGQALWALFTGPIVILSIRYVDDRLEKFVKSREKEFA
ncbi:MAG: rod shape-determining protein MreD [Deltaproteobacteria bacterium]|nr:rod shape-determining protein MreD [Deltaproteobacteria bacterium]